MRRRAPPSYHPRSYAFSLGCVGCATWAAAGVWSDEEAAVAREGDPNRRRQASLLTVLLRLQTMLELVAEGSTVASSLV